jgi:tRNA threonylcarbamoyl adenosine modification protein (Sua5/YciO/YrdC/YwlC family)
VPPVRIAFGDEPEAEVVRRAAGTLVAGGIALLPAEGVYGFHALAAAAAAVERLRALKARAPEKGFICLLARPEDLSTWAEPDPAALDLVRAHWPGALTLVVNASAALPEALRTPDGTVALRCPGSSFLRGVAAAAGGLLVSTSANQPGDPPALRVEAAPAGWADLIVDAGALNGLVSTVARVDLGRVRVLREGAVRMAGSAP